MSSIRVLSLEREAREGGEQAASMDRLVAIESKLLILPLLCVLLES